MRVRLVLGLLVVALIAGVAPVSGVGTFAATPAEAATNRTYGGGPIDEVNAAALAFARPTCGLSNVRLAAMMLAPTFSETGAPPYVAPGPMTLSRWDTQPALYAFGNKSTTYQKAFWHPGVGMWQFDSAGFWPLTAATAIDSRTSARQAAQVMASRFCASTASDVDDKMRYAWAPWYYCGAPGDNKCILKFRDHFSPTGLVNLTRDNSVGRLGGMVQTTCQVIGIGQVPCARVDPAKAQGFAGWANPVFGPTPVTSPFYVFEHAEREYRYWLRQDSGYPQTVVAHKPVTADARNSLTWRLVPVGEGALCDGPAGIGDCSVPFGTFESAVGGRGSIRVEGWAADPDTKQPTSIHVLVDGSELATVPADRPRSDVPVVFPNLGPAHGFLTSVPAMKGDHEVCIVAVDSAPPIVRDVEIGCRTVTVAEDPPFGHLDSAVPNLGGVQVGGWAIDPAVDGAIDVVIEVDGVERQTIRADVVRPDVGAAHPDHGPNHGFVGTVHGLSRGAREICAVARTQDHVLEVELGCLDVAVLGDLPIGMINRSMVEGSTIRLTGWALDPSATAAATVEVQVNGTARGTVIADDVRPDLAGALPGYGTARGFEMVLEDIGPGSHQVCATALDLPAGAQRIALACRVLRVPDGGPIFPDVPVGSAFEGPIGRLSSIGVLSGDTDGMFRPGAPVSRQAAAAILHRAYESPGTVVSTGFPDVPDHHVFAVDIAWLSSVGAVHGSVDGTFRPAGAVTRQALVAMLWRLSGSPTPAGSGSFTDVPAGSQFAQAIAWASENGLVLGYVDGSFRPTSVVSRQATAAVVDRFMTQP